MSDVERLFDLVGKQNIIELLKLLRVPGSHDFINKYNEHEYTPLGLAVEIKNTAKEKNEKIKADIIITILILFGSNAIMCIKQKNFICKLREKDYLAYGGLAQKILQENLIEPLEIAIGKKCFKKLRESLVLNDIDSPVKNKFACIIFNHGQAKKIFYKEASIFKRAQFEDDVEAWNDLCIWYIQCIYYKDKLLLTKNGKYPFVILFNYMWSLKDQSKTSKLYEYFRITLSRKVNDIFKLGLIENNYIAPFIPEILVNSFNIKNKISENNPTFIDNRANKKKTRSKKKKKNNYDYIKVDKDFCLEKHGVLAANTGKIACNVFLEIAFVLSKSAVPCKLYADAFQLLKGIFQGNEFDYNRVYDVHLSQQMIVQFWNDAIKQLLLSHKEYFDGSNTEGEDVENAMVRVFISHTIKFVDLSQINFSIINEFATKFEVNLDEFYVFGSRATLALLHAFKIDDSGFEARDWDLYIKEARFTTFKQHYLKRYHSVSLDFQGESFDLVLLPKDLPSVDSFKNFLICCLSRRLLASPENLLSLFLKKRSFNFVDINPNRLAYFMREVAKNISWSINTEYFLFIQDAKNIAVVQKAIALYLTKYVKNTKSNIFIYFEKSLSPYIAFFGELAAEVKHKAQDMICRFADHIEEDGINYFSSLYLVLLRLLAKKELDLEYKNLIDVFPRNVIFFADFLFNKVCNNDSSGDSQANNQAKLINDSYGDSQANNQAKLIRELQVIFSKKH